MPGEVKARDRRRSPKNGFYWLRSLRITVAVLVLAGFILAFVDFTNGISSGLLRFLGHTQIVPAWQSMLNGMLLGGGVLFAVFVVGTLLFGRVYCSFLCPLGILQDVISRIANKFKRGKNKTYKYAKAHKWVRGGMLLLLVIFSLAGAGALFWTWLDPYSQFGRGAVFLLKPFVQLGNNVFAGVWETPPAWLYTVNVEWVQAGWALLPMLLLLLLVFIFAAWRGRLYCNTICPAGAFLGLLSRYSAFKMVIDQENCFKCAHCARSCKSQCIDLKSSTVDYSRCVNCFDCGYACGNQKAMRYRFTWFAKKDKDRDKGEGKPEHGNREGRRPEKSAGGNDNPENRSDLLSQLPGINRRAFMGSSFMGAWLSLSSCAEEKSGGIIKAACDPKAISPPGSRSLSEFLNACTGCQLCVSACPGNCLKPAYMEYGLKGVMKPRMNYDGGFCQFHCTVCSTICPTGAIKPLEFEEKKVVAVGKAYLDLNHCIPANQKYDCGACAEHCPVAALEMVEFKQPVSVPDHCSSCLKCGKVCPKNAITYTGGDTPKPVIDLEKCIGCGKCKDVCEFDALLMELSKWNVRVPELTQKYCIGCGGCESVCPPVTIRVKGLAEHQQAEVKEEGQVVNPNEGEDFPF